MRAGRLVAVVTSILGLLGAAAISAPPEEGRPALDPGAFSVRLLFGVGDDQPTNWSGRVTVDQGEILGVEGYRFRKGDEISGRDSWTARSHTIRKAAAKKAARAKQSGPSSFGAMVTPNGILVTLKAPNAATLNVETDRGKFQVPLASLADGTVRTFLDGKAHAQRVPVGVPLLDGPDQDDFPAAAADGDGGVWVAYVEHNPRGPDVLESYSQRPKRFADLAPQGGGDQVRLLRFAAGRAGEPLDVTREGLDVWRPAVAVSSDGSVVVAWTENRNGNFDLYRRRYDPAKKTWSDEKRLTTDPGADTDVVLAPSSDGKIWMAWQAWRDGQADIHLAEIEEGSEQVIAVTQSPVNEWSPAIALDRGGRVHVAYDSYQNENYDVFVRSGNAQGAFGPPRAIADSPKFEARPSLAVDPKGRVWVAYEERDADWGLDAENLLQGKGSTLYRSSAVRVRCLDGERVLDAPDPVADARGLRAMNSFPRLACDRDGRLWLAFRHRQEAIWGNNTVMVVGGVWVEYVTSLAGHAWDVPQFLPRSDGLLDNRPALVVPSTGPALAVYSTDGRLRREVEFSPELSRRFWAQSGTPGNPDGVFNEDLEVAALVPNERAGAVDPAVVSRDASPPTQKPAPRTIHLDEAADVARVRDYRIEAGGKSYRLLRGDFHRHTEISQDGGSDGALEDMWRYAIDVARFDWMGNDDHDNGGAKEYTWWLVQKTTDLYHSPKLTTMFTYERSVSYPHGHRNVMFAKRGVRTLPRLVTAQGAISEDDVAMLYDYLKEHDGICASHTSATGMGTDWRANDPKVEPIVEIYQGHRNSYEHLGAPRVARRPGEAIGGWRPLGMVWNALAMQYRLGFQASSDHISTHISYAVAIAEGTGREQILDAFRRRHCYGATDNIVLDVRSGNHIMGDEFQADGPVRLKVFAHGTRPIAKVDVIKDFVYAYSTTPNRPRVEFEWTDDEQRPGGLSWYYVRLEQDDGEIAWASPFWVHHSAR